MVTLIIDRHRVAARARATWYRNQLHPSDVMCGIRRSVHNVHIPGHMHAHRLDEWESVAAVQALCTIRQPTRVENYEVLVILPLETYW